MHDHWNELNECKRLIDCLPSFTVLLAWVNKAICFGSQNQSNRRNIWVAYKCTIEERIAV